MTRSDWLAKLHSLLGVGVLGGFVAFHLFQQWPALWSREHWVDRVQGTSSRTAEVWLVLVPLALHALLGIVRAARGRRTGADLRGSRGLHRVQALTGLIAAAFIVYHLLHVWSWETGPHFSHHVTYDILLQDLGQPLHLALYVVGISAVYFHLGHGISRAAVTWDLVDTAAGVRRARLVGGGLAFLLWALTLQTMANFSMGDGLNPTGRDELPGMLRSGGGAW